jgi:hypothetical protein
MRVRELYQQYDDLKCEFPARPVTRACDRKKITLTNEIATHFAHHRHHSQFGDTMWPKENSY